MELVIRNCNCIEKAKIEIIPNTLNIKYGVNGTGKTTISKAIFAQSMGDNQRLNKLLAYGTTEDNTENCPSVEGLNFSKVMVFDDEYVNSYLLQGNEIFDDSFKVFLRSNKCDDLAKQIGDMLSELQGIFQISDEIKTLRNLLPEYFSAIKYANGNISTKGGVGEFIKGNGGGFERYSELDSYKPYYSGQEMAKVSKWAKWRNDGTKVMQGDCCPFCTHDLEDSIREENIIIAKVFKNSALSTANAVLDYLRKAVDMKYIKEDAVGVLEEYIGNANKADALLAELSQLATETDYLNKKIEKICMFRPMNVTHDQLVNIETSLDNMLIDERQISKFYSTEFIKNLIKLISEKIEQLKNNTGVLKGLFIQHERKLSNLIEERKEDINHFFALAGFPYNFGLEKGGENKAVAYLKPANGVIERVNEPGEHLSWGERNAFSLVMFMFEVISEEADLIVLDDPISSFDKNKKFAVIRRMFDNQKESFRDKTVIMLTHDMQPIIDYVHGGFFTSYGLTTPVNAMILQNVKGNIIESPIYQEDLKNTVEFTRQITEDSSQLTLVRVVNLRKYVELTYSGFREAPIYEVLSNIIHGRLTAKDKDGNKLEKSIFEAGCQDLNKYIPDKDYDSIIAELSTEKLVKQLDELGNYEKIIAIRLLFERKKGILSLLRQRYPGACKFINETNHIENDYVFQLNPLKFFDIPQFYLEELEKFIEDEKLAFEQ